MIIATGSEVQLALAAQTPGRAQDRRARGLHAPAPLHRWLTADVKYKQLDAARRLPPRIANRDGRDRRLVEIRMRRVIGIDTYGESAPTGVLFKHFGFAAGERSRPCVPRFLLQALKFSHPRA